MLAPCAAGYHDPRTKFGTCGIITAIVSTAVPFEKPIDFSHSFHFYNSVVSLSAFSVSGKCPGTHSKFNAFYSNCYTVRIRRPDAVDVELCSLELVSVGFISCSGILLLLCIPSRL